MARNWGLSSTAREELDPNNSHVSDLGAGPSPVKLKTTKAQLTPALKPERDPEEETQVSFAQIPEFRTETEVMSVIVLRHKFVGYCVI